MDEAPKKLSKSERTRAAILAAGRELFAAQGFERTTVREIAARADIDPALVVRYFGGKDALFAQAAEFDLRLPDLAATPRPEIGATLVRHFLAIWEAGDADGGFTVLLRSAASNEFAAERLRAVFAGQVLPGLVRAGLDSGAPERAGLVSTQLLGLAMCRYVLKLPPVVGMRSEAVVAALGPTLQRYLFGGDPV
jgi:AcrR family transcriptional regulator